MTGHEYAILVARYVLKNFEQRGLRVYREIPIGKSIIGKDRRADLFLVDDRSNKGFVVQCKFQDKSGTADEKIPYAIDDLRAMRLPGCLAYGGEGFSMGILHMLRASDMAAYCLPPADLARTDDTWQLDHVLAIQFGWWDLLTDERRRVHLSPERISHGGEEERRVGLEKRDQFPSFQQQDLLSSAPPCEKKSEA